jgi:hypothetical protein
MEIVTTYRFLIFDKSHAALPALFIYAYKWRVSCKSQKILLIAYQPSFVFTDILLSMLHLCLSVRCRSFFFFRVSLIINI